MHRHSCHGSGAVGSFFAQLHLCYTSAYIKALLPRRPSMPSAAGRAPPALPTPVAAAGPAWMRDSLRCAPTCDFPLSSLPAAPSPPRPASRCLKPRPRTASAACKRSSRPPQRQQWRPTTTRSTAKTIPPPDPGIRTGLRSTPSHRTPCWCCRNHPALDTSRDADASSHACLGSMPPPGTHTARQAG